MKILEGFVDCLILIFPIFPKKKRKKRERKKERRRRYFLIKPAFEEK